VLEGGLDQLLAAFMGEGRDLEDRALEPEALDEILHPRFALLRRVKLGAVRAIFSPKVYRRSHGRALAWLAFDAACYLGLIAGIYLVPGALAKLALGVVAGAVVSFLFVWAHDAAHGSLFGSSRWAERSPASVPGSQECGAGSPRHARTSPSRKGMKHTA